MKNIILALSICAVAVLSGCGQADSSSADGETSYAAESVSSADDDRLSEEQLPDAEESTAEEDESEISDSSDESTEAQAEQALTEDIVTVEPKYDPAVVNEGVERAVAENSPEAANPSGWYWFTWQNFGNVYSNEELENCFERIQEICENADFSLSFSYKNLDTGARVDYDQYADYLTCSTIKAPYVETLLRMGIDLDDVIVRNDCWSGDDGAVASAPYGTEFTARELIEHTILESDNTAYYLLVKNYGYWQFNNDLYNIGVSYRLGDSWIFTHSYTADMLKCYEDIYYFGEENEQGAWLVELLSDTDLNIQIGKALGEKYTVAQKYGSEFTERTFNDCAIVYADSPFVLCIFTDQYPETEESCQVFKELAVVFDDINTLLADK